MRIDSPIMTNAVATGSFTGSFSGDGSNLTGIVHYTDSDTLAYINTLNVLSGSDGYTTDVELNASSSALITGYTNADNSLSSSLAADIAINTAKIGYTDALVKTKLNAENVVSASSFSSPSQGTVRATINGVNTDVDTGLQAGDSPTFANLVVTGNLTVEGTRTELQVTELNVEDKNILIASGAADSAAADGAGITIGGANESITWNHANSRFNISDDLNIEGNITLTGTVDGVDIAALNTTVSNLNDTYATDAELNASSSALITAYTNADNSLSSSLAPDIASNLAAIQSNDTDISNLQTASGSFSTRVTTNESNISDLTSASGSFSTRVTSVEDSLSNLNNTYATDAELNASSSALITAYGNADNALSSSLATALTSEYQAADTTLSSSLATDIATNTAKIGVTTETVRTAGALMDDEVDADIKTLSLPASTTISAFGKTLIDDADAATARTTLGVDAAGTDNSTDVTLVGSYDYITITGQTITRNQITNDDLAGSIANAKLANSSITINGSAVSLGGSRTLVTDDIAEDGSPVNLWYTDTRVKTKLNSDNVVSGSATQVRTFLNVENGADVTDTANVTAAGALMDSEVTNLAQVKAFDSSDYATAAQGILADSAVQNLGDLSITATAAEINKLDGVTATTAELNYIDGVTSNIQTQLNTKAPLASPAFTGNPTAPTQTGTDDSTKIATTAFVQGRIDAIIGTAGATLDTLGEISASLSDDQDALTALTTTVGTKLAKSANLSDLTNAATARTNLGVDPAGTVNYTHPTHPGDDFSVDTGALTGATVVSDIDINVTTDTLGHVTDANGTVSTRTLTLADLGYTGATNANNYVHPTHPGDDFSIDTGALTGATVISDLDINVTTDTLGHVTDANATVATRTLTAANLSLGTSDDVQFNSLGIGTAAPGTTGVIRATNDIVAYYSSDERLKDNITTIPNALEKVETLRGVEFDWNNNQEVYSGHDIGVIAQEVEAILPEIVETRDNGYKAVKYEKLTAVLIQAVKELSARVKELESK